MQELLNDIEGRADELELLLQIYAEDDTSNESTRKIIAETIQVLRDSTKEICDHFALARSTEKQRKDVMAPPGRLHVEASVPVDSVTVERLREMSPQQLVEFATSMNFERMFRMHPDTRAYLSHCLIGVLRERTDELEIFHTRSDNDDAPFTLNLKTSAS